MKKAAPAIHGKRPETIKAKKVSSPSSSKSTPSWKRCTPKLAHRSIENPDWLPVDMGDGTVVYQWWQHALFLTGGPIYLPGRNR